MPNTNRAPLPFCISKELIAKVEYIAKFEGRSKNEEFEQMLREWIRAFEETEGPITIPPPKKDPP